MTNFAPSKLARARMGTDIQRKTSEKQSMILIQDLVLSLLASLLSILVVRWISEPIPGFTMLVCIWLGISLVGSSAGVFFFKPYKDIPRYSTVRSIAKVVMAILVKEAVLFLALVLGAVSLPSGPFALLAILSDLMLTGIFMLYIRFYARVFSRDNTRIEEKAARKTALVQGTSASSLHLAAELRREGWEVLGLTTRDKDLVGRVISDHVVYYCNDEDDLARLQWRFGGIDGLFFPQRGGVRNDSSRGSEGDSEATAGQKDGMSGIGHLVKRIFDISLSGILLLLFSPVIAVCAILVKREDGGKVIFAQERIGRGGKPFQIYKFRTMRPNAEKDCPVLYCGEQDPRLTKTGRFLRAHHLDELPQLWNVFKGDMSFIGYRPERQYFIDQIMEYNSRYCYLYQIRPGVTSYATLYNGYTDTIEKMLTRLDLDLYYLRNHSVWFDMKVLGLTFLSIVSGKKF